MTLRIRVWWTAAAVLIAAAGVVAALAAMIHWLPCFGVSFDSAACMDRQHDYRYYLPYDHDSYGWQPVAGVPALAAAARLLTAVGWLCVVAGLPTRLAIRAALSVLAGLPLSSAAGIYLAGSTEAGAATMLAPIAITLGVLGVAVARVLVSSVMTRTPAPVTGGVVAGALALAMFTMPVHLVDFLVSSTWYGSHDNPPFLGLLPGLWLVGCALVLATAAHVRSHQPELPGPPLKGPTTAAVIQPP